MRIVYDFHDCRLGRLVVAATADGLAAICFTEEGEDWTRGLPRRLRSAERTRQPEDLTPIRAWLEAYFQGERVAKSDYEGDLDPGGTDFQQRVWNALTEIHYGRTTSYGEIARRIGSPDAVRAVGAANGANPLPILVPCHRVVGSTGKLTGFGGGLWRKRALLELERGGELFGTV